MADGEGERISDAEHAVMEALWNRAPLSAAEVCDEETRADRDWNSRPRSRHYFLAWLVKNAVTTEAEGKRFLYSPAIERTRYLGGELRRLVDRLFGGKPARAGRTSGAERGAQPARYRGNRSAAGNAQGPRAYRGRGQTICWLFDTLVWSGVLIAAVLVLRRPVARIFGAGMAYALWLLPLLRLVMPPLVLPTAPPPRLPRTRSRHRSRDGYVCRTSRRPGADPALGTAVEHRLAGGQEPPCS